MSLGLFLHDKTVSALVNCIHCYPLFHQTSTMWNKWRCGKGCPNAELHTQIQSLHDFTNSYFSQTSLCFQTQLGLCVSKILYLKVYRNYDLTEICPIAWQDRKWINLNPLKKALLLKCFLTFEPLILSTCFKKSAIMDIFILSVV